jgi:hypothetical protein
MADGRGGYRRPSSPAPVSGPGSLSQRTDGKQPVRVPTGGQYGAAQAMQQTQQGAPMASSGGGDAAPMPGLLAGLSLPEGVSGDAATQQPDTPVTAGAALGAGPGSEALGISPQQDDDLKALVQYLPVLEMMASEPGASKASRNLVRQLKGLAGT